MSWSVFVEEDPDSVSLPTECSTYKDASELRLRCGEFGMELAADWVDGPPTDFAWIYRPCDELAGDGLDVIPLGDGKLGLYVLDVSGYGVAAALLSVTLSRLLSPPSEPSSILIRDGEDRERDRDRFDITSPPSMIDSCPRGSSPSARAK